MLQNMASPFISAASCPTCSSPHGCICQNIGHGALANAARQKIPFGVQSSGFYSPETWPGSSSSAGSSPYGCSSGSSSGGYPTPLSSDRLAFQGDLAHSPVHHPPGGYPGGQGPFLPLSPQAPRNEPYNCGQTISCPPPQYADEPYSAANNNLGLLFRQPFTSSQRAAYENANPHIMYSNSNTHAAPPFNDVAYAIGVDSAAGNNSSFARDMKSDVGFTSYGELEPLTIDYGHE